MSKHKIKALPPGFRKSGWERSRGQNLWTLGPSGSPQMNLSYNYNPGEGWAVWYSQSDLIVHKRTLAELLAVVTAFLISGVWPQAGEPGVFEG